MERRFEPRDADYRAKVIESFDRQEVMKTLNASIMTVYNRQGIEL